MLLNQHCPLNSISKDVKFIHSRVLTITILYIFAIETINKQ